MELVWTSQTGTLRQFVNYSKAKNVEKKYLKPSYISPKRIFYHSTVDVAAIAITVARGRPTV